MVYNTSDDCPYWASGGLAADQQQVSKFRSDG